jgi:hypothetical protein
MRDSCRHRLISMMSKGSSREKQKSPSVPRGFDEDLNSNASWCRLHLVAARFSREIAGTRIGMPSTSVECKEVEICLRRHTGAGAGRLIKVPSPEAPCWSKLNGWMFQDNVGTGVPASAAAGLHFVNLYIYARKGQTISGISGRCCRRIHGSTLRLLLIVQSCLVDSRTARDGIVQDGAL